MRPVLLLSVGVVSGLLTEWELQVFLFFNGPELREVTQLQSQGGRKCGCLEKKVEPVWPVGSSVSCRGRGGWGGPRLLREESASPPAGCGGHIPSRVCWEGTCAGGTPRKLLELRGEH